MLLEPALAKPASLGATMPSPLVKGHSDLEQVAVLAYGAAHALQAVLAAVLILAVDHHPAWVECGSSVAVAWG